MENFKATALMSIHKKGMQVHDYYIVGDEICISKPRYPLSSLEIDHPEVLKAGLSYLKENGVPSFSSWYEYSEVDGENIILNYRKNDR
ncbi:MAG: hypothetical protein RIE52_04130 [Balneola sp.]